MNSKLVFRRGWILLSRRNKLLHFLLGGTRREIEREGNCRKLVVCCFRVISFAFPPKLADRKKERNRKRERQKKINKTRELRLCIFAADSSAFT